MPELIRFVNPNFSSLIWHITESIDFLLERISLSETEFAYFEMLKSEQRKKQWLAYRSALMLMNDNIHIPINYSEIGKPVLSTHSAVISVSHSGIYAQAIISKTTRVGVDVEINFETPHLVRHKFMSQKEIIYADSINGKLVSMLTWCAKEAMYKAMGLEGVIFAQDMIVFDFDFILLLAKGSFHFNNCTSAFEIKFIQHEKFISAMCFEIV